jgi:GNAT superfamily N-acetyltransferase
VVVEEMVRDLLLDAVIAGDCQAVGAWDGHELCGVAAWRIETSARLLRCRSILLAVRTGRRRMGYGRALKKAVVADARRAGASAVISLVHFDNDPMIELNVALGANVERIPGDPDHLLCVLPVNG